MKEKSQIASVCTLTYDNLNSCTDITLPILWSSLIEDGVPILNPAHRTLIGLWSIVSPTVQTAAKAHNTWLICSTERIGGSDSWARLRQLGNVIATSPTHVNISARRELLKGLVHPKMKSQSFSTLTSMSMERQVKLLRPENISRAPEMNLSFNKQVSK